MREVIFFGPAPELGMAGTIFEERPNMHYVRRGDKRRLTGDISQVFDILEGQKETLGIVSIALGRMGAQGGKQRVRIYKANGKEVVFNVLGSAQRQEIRVTTNNQQRTILEAAKALRDSNIPIRFGEHCDD